MIKTMRRFYCGHALPDSILAGGINLVPHMKQIFATPRGQQYITERGIPEIKVFNRQREMNTHGVAYWRKNRIILNVMPRVDAFDILSTLVHEIAHLAAPREEHHGEIWGRIFKKLALQTYDVDMRPTRLHMLDEGLHVHLRDRSRKGALYMPDPMRILDM